MGSLYTACAVVVSGEWFDVRWVCPIEYYGHFEWIAARDQICLTAGLHWVNLSTLEKNKVTLLAVWLLGGSQ